MNILVNETLCALVRSTPFVEFRIAPPVQFAEVEQVPPFPWT
jgi:hypothetical protein